MVSIRMKDTLRYVAKLINATLPIIAIFGLLAVYLHPFGVRLFFAYAAITTWGTASFFEVWLIQNEKRESARAISQIDEGLDRKKVVFSSDKENSEKEITFEMLIPSASVSAVLSLSEKYQFLTDEIWGNFLCFMIETERETVKKDVIFDVAFAVEKEFIVDKVLKKYPEMSENVYFIY